MLNERLNGRQPATDEARSVIRGDLRDLDASLRLATARAADRATRLHLQDARDQIARILDPKLPTPGAAAAPGARTTIDDTWPENPDSCWPDYIVRPIKKQGLQ